MKILYLGDIVGKPGRDLIAKNLSNIRIKYDIDVVIAQSENVTHGKGLSVAHYNELRTHGVDGFSGGNHTFERPDTMRLVMDESKPVAAPLNRLNRKFPPYKIIKISDKKVLLASVLGTVFPDSGNKDFTSTLDSVDDLMKMTRHFKLDAFVLNIHGDLSSQKVIMGHYLDGRATAVVGDHWHTPTADYRVLPGGTAHTTDVGMCGTLDSSLGATYDSVINRWRGGKRSGFVIQESGAMQINGVIIQTCEKGILAKTIKQLRIIT